jgi:hypothetical protein
VNFVGAFFLFCCVGAFPYDRTDLLIAGKGGVRVSVFFVSVCPFLGFFFFAREIEHANIKQKMQIKPGTFM